MSRSSHSPVVAGALALLLAACGDHPLAQTRDVRPAASASPQAPDVAELFSPGVISDAAEQWRITFSANGKEAYFARSAQFFPFTRRATIYESHLGKDGVWSTPVVAPFSGVYSDIDPFLSPDGRRLYFSSIRPIDGAPRQDIDLWYVERQGDGWGAPVHLGPEVNDPNADELYASASADGTLYFASGPFFPQPGRHFDIYRAERRGSGFATRVALDDAVNTVPSPTDPSLQSAWDFNPEISVDGHTLVFTSLRPGGFGLGDLYVSTRHGDRWTKARNLGPVVNTSDDEYHPTLSRNRRELYFVRGNVGRGLRGDFYRVGTRALDLR
jgi:Tol biopolymer transport system component